ncbi:hypothetical protein [Aliterella atlantica]|uniref:Uncharacterized protein n=1 Tax=Aliterella atlantica CENA595 TaxID=1618023 RepID=A0A0D8ZKU6_9CYAN|nr:hypothetical protein [Aliterella atlantica]KJH69355.1 hypothetical protein UH38_24380 [Aliterella atlantica CENA595]
MDINELTKNLCDRSVAIELITWLRENELLANNSGNEVTDTDLAEIFAFHSPEKGEILAQIHKLLAASKQSTFTDAIVDTWVEPKFSRTTTSAPKRCLQSESPQASLKPVTILSCLPQEERDLIVLALISLLQAEGEDFLLAEEQVNLAASILYVVSKRSGATI